MTVVNKSHAVTQVFKLTQVVRGYYRCHSSCGNAVNQYALERLADNYIKPVKRFIKQKIIGG